MNAVDTRPVIRRDVDLLVVGAGATGVATAVTAARQGLSVLLAERYGFCGGGAVAGLSGTVCGLYLATDNPKKPEQVVFGFAEEFVRRLETSGGLAPPVLYGKTFTRVHDPLIWRETADALLREAGVETVFHALAIGALIEGGSRIHGARLATKQGPLDVRADLVVDASGDADIVAMAGLESVIGLEGRVQNPTMIFRMMGVDTATFKAAYGPDTIMPRSVTEAILQAREAGAHLPRAKIWLFTTPRPGELLCNCTRVVGGDGRELNTLYYKDFSEAEIEGRAQARSYARFFREHLHGCENAFVEDTGVQVGVRQTRQGAGISRLLNADVVNGRKFTDGIAVSPWPIELHSGERPRVEWLIDDVYEIPFGCFVPIHGEGLLFGGRCLSAEHEAVASARVTAQCFSYGHAIGHASVLAVRESMGVKSISGAEIRDILNRDGARLG